MRYPSYCGKQSSALYPVAKPKKIYSNNAIAPLMYNKSPSSQRTMQPLPHYFETMSKSHVVYAQIKKLKSASIALPQCTVKYPTLHTRIFAVSRAYLCPLPRAPASRSFCLEARPREGRKMGFPGSCISLQACGVQPSRDG